MKIVPLLARCLALVVVISARATAQGHHIRSGFWLNVGLGAASFGCENCDGRERGAALSFSLGATLSQHLNVGVGANAWAAVFNGASTVTAMMRYYPSAQGGFFLTGGVGRGVKDHVSPLGGEERSESGLGVLLGLGVDLRIARNLSLTPFGHLNALNLDSGNSNFGQLGLGLTVH